MTLEMMDILRIACLVIGVLGFVQVVLQLLITYECTRFFRSRVTRKLDGVYTPKVQLTLPCKGCETSFDQQILAIRQLDYPDYTVTFVVESKADPAFERLTALLVVPGGAPARIVVAGVSRDCGQKVHNLLVATADRSPEVEVFAFADSDAVVDSDWLRRLVFPLHQSSRGAVTGYRWFVPESSGLSAIVLSAMNAGLVMLGGNHSRNLIWGGSWACRREVFESIISEGAWQGSLTDDLPITHVLKRHGLTAVFEPSCLVASPLNCTWQSMAEFTRRQYLIARIYSPRMWWFALSATFLSQTVFWGSAIAFLGFDLGGATGWVLGLLVAVYGINTIRAIMRQRAASLRFPIRTVNARWAAWLDILGHPLLGLGHFLFLLASIGREITWRGIRYRLHNAHKTEILSRPAPFALQAR